MAPSTPARVLCVDDDPALITLWQRFLTAAGMRVHAEAGSEAALRALKANEFDVVLCDYRMPGLDGIDVLANSRECQPDASRIMISAEADVEMAVQAINRVGLFRLLTKPVRMVELGQVVAEGADAARLRRDNRALAMQLAHRNAQLEQLNRSLQERVSSQAMHAVCAMLSALGLWSEEHLKHAEHTTRLAQRMTRQLDLPSTDSAVIEQGAMLHDVGLLSVPRSLLLFPGPLDAEAEAEYRNHVAAGSMLVQELGLDSDVRRIVAEHHERWDGTGYPSQLVGEQIHLGARIVAVCAAYVSNTQGSPCRAPASHSIALSEIKQWSGLHFDPRVVIALCSIPTPDFDCLASPTSPRRAPCSPRQTLPLWSKLLPDL